MVVKPGAFTSLWGAGFDLYRSPPQAGPQQVHHHHVVLALPPLEVHLRHAQNPSQRAKRAGAGRLRKLVKGGEGKEQGSCKGGRVGGEVSKVCDEGEKAEGLSRPPQQTFTVCACGVFFFIRGCQVDLRGVLSFFVRR